MKIHYLIFSLAILFGLATYSDNSKIRPVQLTGEYLPNPAVVDIASQIVSDVDFSSMVFTVQTPPEG